MKIRLAKPGDARRVREIYGQYIHTPVTFEDRLPSLPEFTDRMARIASGYPFLVCADEGGTVRGYAYAHAQAERQAYQWNAELSIYLDRDCRGRGLAGTLYPPLFALLRLQNIHTLYALVTLPNAASERLHARFGFGTMGVQRSAGYKAGKWHDVAWLTKRIAEYEDSPSGFVPLPLLPEGLVAEILRSAP